MPGLKKVREHFLVSLLRLLFVNALHQDMLVLQHVTLHLHVHVVVHEFVVSSWHHSTCAEASSTLGSTSTIAPFNADDTRASAPAAISLQMGTLISY